MIIIETCPKCGHDLHDVMLASFPPIPKKECFNCGWSWTGEPEQVMRVPFGGNSLNVDSKYELNGSIYDEIIDSCMASNLNSNLFTVNKIDLDSISGISYDDIVAAYDDIVAAMERAQKYIKK